MKLNLTILGVLVICAACSQISYGTGTFPGDQDYTSATGTSSA